MSNIRPSASQCSRWPRAVTSRFPRIALGARPLRVCDAGLQESTGCRAPGHYLNRPEYIARILDRSRRYLYHIVEEVEKRGMPTEIALLPMIESAYNPTALFVRARLRYLAVHSVDRPHLRTRPERWYDERRDVRAGDPGRPGLSREALRDVRQLGSRARRLQRRRRYGLARDRAQRAAGLPTDYVSLPLPAETRNYVPKLQAVKQLVAAIRNAMASPSSTFPTRLTFRRLPPDVRWTRRQQRGSLEFPSLSSFR